MGVMGSLVNRCEMWVLWGVNKCEMWVLWGVKSIGVRCGCYGESSQ